MEIEKSLYALTQELKSEFDLILESGGEITENEEEKIEALTKLIENKTDSCVGYYDMLGDQLEVVKKHIEVLTSMKKQIENKQEKFKLYLESCLVLSGRDEFKGEISTIKKRKKSLVVNILDESKIPIEFLEEEIKIKIKKKEIGDALKNGEIVDGAELVESEKPSLIIKKGV